MGLLEDALRETMGAQVASPPAVDNAAGRAIDRARRMRARRSTLAAAAVVLSLALIAGIAGVRGVPTGAGVGLGPASPDGDVWSAALPVDVLTGNEITLAMGPVISLTDLPPIRQAWRVAGGWLVRTLGAVSAQDLARIDVNEPDPVSAVWFVGQSGAKTRLAEGRQVAVGRSGRGNHDGEVLVAWGGDGRVSVATFVDGQLGQPISTAGTSDLRPQEIVAGAVLLVDEAMATYQMWFPGQGAYVAGPRFEDPVLGVTSVGDALLALIGLRRTCLAVIAPAGFGVLRSRCDLDLGPGDLVSASPDGQWLVALSRNGVDLYDFGDVWRSPAPVANWQVNATAVSWLADGSFVVVEENRVVRLRASAPTREEVAQVALTDGQALMAITDLRD